MDPLAAWRIGAEPYYQASGDEIALFEAAHASGLPLLLKGPTGCGKTRFVEHMAWRLQRPLVTIACHDDLSAADLVGRWLLDADGTRWQDGPLTLAVRHGAICYLDEVVEARQDTVVVLHSLTDHRRILPIDKTGETLQAAPGFMLVISYNPGYQRMLKDLKPSTRQRFVALEFDFPAPEIEARVREKLEFVDLDPDPLLPEPRRHLVTGQLDGLKFRELFAWLSASLSNVSKSQVGQAVPLQPPSGWAEV